ncbi:hypothetical protein [Lactobacillus gasseri]|uniref:hypothetical protein n=1 Tax=Lactobacillus gasseri TaxID=1596 RepID=UPI000389EC89|nr:hypothetical protein [Lactobacillus gasseri]MCZ3541796.1 hypothetical protein [Lactobacillus gasseri]MCZ3589421.1 hypothetical protein [Lactobacillus gasseri]UJD19659.1 hypothetical protein M497_03660 [Lactobacillus gasseri 2016]
MADNSNKKLTGKQLSFNADIKNFKADSGNVVITMNASSKDIDLNILNSIVSNSVTVDLVSVQTKLLEEPVND